jgi:hypothetical protein
MTVKNHGTRHGHGTVTARSRHGLEGIFSINHIAREHRSFFTVIQTPLYRFRCACVQHRQGWIRHVGVHFSHSYIHILHIVFFFSFLECSSRTNSSGIDNYHTLDKRTIPGVSKGLSNQVNSPFPLWRRDTTTTRILFVASFVTLIHRYSHRSYQHLNKKNNSKGILVVVVSRRHKGNGEFCRCTWSCKQTAQTTGNPLKLLINKSVSLAPFGKTKPGWQIRITKAMFIQTTHPITLTKEVNSIKLFHGFFSHLEIEVSTICNEYHRNRGVHYCYCFCHSYLWM